MKMKLTLILLTLTLTLYAQTNMPAAPMVEAMPIPTSKVDFWVWAIAGVAPLIVAGIKTLVPKIPKLLLPVSTPFIGIGLGLILNALSTSNLGWVEMSQAGALAVFIRETLDQTVKQVAKSTSPTE